MTTVPTVPSAPATPLDPSNPTAHTRAFFDALYADAPDGHHALLWTLQDKRSTWLPAGDAPVVADRARQLADDGKDVYVAVSVSAASGRHDTRIKSDNAAGIFGLWADLDVADPDVHKKWNLPPSIDAAMELLEAAGLPPTLVVHSGHGLQAWWLFHEFWAFGDEGARSEAAGLAQRWNTTLQVRAAERSWTVDSTYDLARVMRVPGTLNRKGSPVMPVRLLVADGPRYQPDDFDAYVVDGNYLSARGLTPTREYVPDEVELSDANRVDFELLQAATDNSDVFKATWDKARKDFPDQSPSSYDLSLATQAAAIGWTDQQIADLIHSFRRRHKLDVSKALRKDYIERTLKKAREAMSRADATEALEEVGDALDEAKRTGDDEAIRPARRAALDVIGEQLRVEVLHLIKYLSEPPAYAIVTPTQTVNLGGGDGLLNWSKFRQSMFEGADVLIPRFKASEWDDVNALMIKALEDQDVGAEATERGELSSWLVSYLAQRPPVDSLEEAAGSEYPFKGEDGRVCMFGPGFKRWLWLTFQEKITPKELGRRLRAYGCDPDKINVEVDGKRTSRGIWRLPAGVGV